MLDSVVTRILHKNALTCDFQTTKIFSWEGVYPSSDATPFSPKPENETKLTGIPPQRKYWLCDVEMGIEPNNKGSGSVRFGHCYSSGSVRVRLILC